MKKMMLSIFLMLLSIWCLIFGIADNSDLFIIVAVALPIFAIFFFFSGYLEKETDPKS